MNHQSFEDWLKSPIQGAIPLPPGVQEQLDQRCPCMSKPIAECDCQIDSPQQGICNDLATAQTFLQAAYDAATSSQLGATHNDLYMAICDSFNACNEALQRINDAPDEPYDVAISELPPTKGKVNPPESAF
jgi:hypothetical protein